MLGALGVTAGSTLGWELSAWSAEGAVIDRGDPGIIGALVQVMMMGLVEGMFRALVASVAALCGGLMGVGASLVIALKVGRRRALAALAQAEQAPSSGAQHAP